MKPLLLSMLMPFWCMALQAQCTLSCFANITGELDNTCEYVLTEPDAGIVDCPTGVISIEIFDDQMNLIPTSPMVDGSYVGTNLSFVISDAVSGNFCTGNLSLIDILSPIVSCPADAEVECIGDNLPIPTIIDNCPNISLQLMNEVFVPLTCNPEFVGELIQDFQAIDESGNTANCTSNIFIKRLDLSSIIWPQNYTLADNTELSCEDSIDPNDTGYPMYNGEELTAGFPACNITVGYVDDQINVNCVVKTIRSWTISESWCGNTNQVQHTQIIDQVDTTPPVAFCLAGLSAALGNDGTLELFASDFDAGSFDNCGGNVTFDSTPILFSCDDIGLNIIQLTVYDECLNSSICLTTVQIEDPSDFCPPVILNIQGNLDQDESFCSGEIIESDACIDANLNIEYTAPLLISLEPGFEVPASSNFEAIIDDCIVN